MVDQETLTLDMLSEDCIALSDTIQRRAAEEGYPAMAWQIRQIARRYRRLLNILYEEGHDSLIPPDPQEAGREISDPPLQGVYNANAGRLIVPHYTAWKHRLDETGVRTVCGKNILPYDYVVVAEDDPHEFCPMCYLLTRNETSPTNPTN